MAKFKRLDSQEIPAEVREERNARRRDEYAACKRMDESMSTIVDVVCKKAEGGDTKAARLVLDKRLANAKEPTQIIPGIDDPDPQIAGEAVMKCLARGEIGPESASSHLNAVMKRAEITLLRHGLTLDGAQFMKLMQVRNLLRGSPFQALTPTVSVGRSDGQH